MSEFRGEVGSGPESAGVVDAAPRSPGADRFGDYARHDGRKCAPQELGYLAVSAAYLAQIDGNLARAIPEKLVKSKQRARDHGEVFTPANLVEDMLDLVSDEMERIDSRVLEPACGSGNFLAPALERKLLAVKKRYGRSKFENRHYALLALMCLYGIELLEDNVEECRERLLDIFARYLKIGNDDAAYHAAEFVLSVNVVHGDALAMKTLSGDPLIFSEWAYLGLGRYQRREFLYVELTSREPFEGHECRHEVLAPLCSHKPVKMEGLAR